MASGLVLTCRATRQLSGAIADLNCVASSILPDYDAATGLWDDRAGGWSYDYDNQGAGASLYGLDAVNVHSAAATTDKEFMTTLSERIAYRREDAITVGYGAGLAATAPAMTPVVSSCAARRSRTHSWQAGRLSVPGFSHSVGSGGSAKQLKRFHREESPLALYASHIRPPVNIAAFTRS